MYDKKRPAIPAELKRSVLVRAGHACEIANCSEKTYVDIHHIDCNRENNEIDNLIVLCGPHHRMAHDGKIDRKALKSYISNPQQTFIHSVEVERVLKFLEAIKLCLTEYGNGYPEPVGDQLYYFFTKSVHAEMCNFLGSGKYQSQLKSFDTAVSYKQDKIVSCMTQIIQSVTTDKYSEIGLSYKLAGNCPHGAEREHLIKSQDQLINPRLKQIVALYNELNQYCLRR
jgi:hypothetical protein